nr:collagen alpha-1(III) chain-like [Dasypus novemcinctus]
MPLAHARAPGATIRAAAGGTLPLCIIAAAAAGRRTRRGPRAGGGGRGASPGGAPGRGRGRAAGGRAGRRAGAGPDRRPRRSGRRLSRRCPPRPAAGRSSPAGRTPGGSPPRPSPGGSSAEASEPAGRGPSSARRAPRHPCDPAERGAGGWASGRRACSRRRGEDGEGGWGGRWSRSAALTGGRRRQSPRPRDPPGGPGASERLRGTRRPPGWRAAEWGGGDKDIAAARSLREEGRGRGRGPGRGGERAAGGSRAELRGRGSRPARGGGFVVSSRPRAGAGRRARGPRRGKSLAANPGAGCGGSRRHAAPAKTPAAGDCSGDSGCRPRHPHPPLPSKASARRGKPGERPSCRGDGSGEAPAGRPRGRGAGGSAQGRGGVPPTRRARASAARSCRLPAGCCGPSRARTPPGGRRPTPPGDPGSRAPQPPGPHFTAAPAGDEGGEERGALGRTRGRSGGTQGVETRVASLGLEGGEGCDRGRGRGLRAGRAGPHLLRPRWTPTWRRGAGGGLLRGGEPPPPPSTRSVAPGSPGRRLQALDGGVTWERCVRVARGHGLTDGEVGRAKGRPGAPAEATGAGARRRREELEARGEPAGLAGSAGKTPRDALFVAARGRPGRAGAGTAPAGIEGPGSGSCAREEGVVGGSGVEKQVSHLRRNSKDQSAGAGWRVDR